MTKKTLATILIIVTFLLLIFFVFIPYFKNFENGRVLSELENKKTIEFKDVSQDKNLSEIDALIGLPEDEKANFGVINNIDALKAKKDVFKKAKKGDIVLIYPDLMIIYDPVNKVIVDIAKEEVLK